MIILYSNSKGYLKEKDIRKIDDIEKSIGVIDTRGEYKYSPYDKIHMNILGMTIEDYKKLYNLTILEKLNDAQLNNKSIMVSSIFTKEYGLNIGDSIDLIIRDSKYKFNIGYIVVPTYRFKPDKNNPNNETILIQKEYLNQLFGLNSKTYSLYVINKDGVDSKAIKL